MILGALATVLAVIVVVLLATRPRSIVPPRGEGGREILYYRDPMNPSNTSPVPRKAPDGMDYVPVYAGDAGGGTAEGVVRVDPATIQSAAVRTEVVARRDLTKTIRTVGRVDYDETRLYSITTKVSGYIDTLYVNFTGEKVRQDQPLLEIYSPQVVSAQQEYLLARKTAQALSGRGRDEELRAAEDLVSSARMRLELWDIPAHEIRELEARGAPRRTVMLHSPVDGIVVEKAVLEGAAIGPGMNLFKIADLSRVWVYGDVFEYELPWIRVGAAAEAELAYLPGTVFHGRVVYIDPYLSPETRTARVRIELANPQGQIVLRPEMFATVRLKAPPMTNVLAVPDQAVIRSGERDLVVVALGEGRFTSREVRVGLQAGDFVEILSGLNGGDRIVTSSQFLIDSESNLRAAVAALAPPDSAAAARDSSAHRGAHAMPGMGRERAGEAPSSGGSESDHH
jgi:Cu(I)/Ag(I) efflux system membrane fusion protein